MIRRLSDLLRYCLATSNVPQVPLSDEIHFAKAYLDIQKIRFEDRLEISFDVDDNERESLVPSFILQPLIENAVKFSLNNDHRVARIAVSARRIDGRMRLTVTDNGPGIRVADLDQSAGVGVRTTRERLRQLYGDDQTMSFDKTSGGGTTVVISIPDGR